MKGVSILVVLLVMLLLPACDVQAAYEPEVYDYALAEEAAAEIEVEPIQYVAPSQDNFRHSWQEAYAALLRDNYAGVRYSDCGGYSGTNSFLLYDIDMDNVPELFVVDSFDYVVTVYSYRNGEVVSIEFGENDIPLAGLLHGAARMGIGPTHEGMPGFVFRDRWPSAGMFGTGVDFWRVVIEGDSLVIADHGEWYIDISALHELLDNFGRDADPDILDAAIAEHTHLRINGDIVSEEELNRVFGRDLETGGAFRRYAVDEANIIDVIGSAASYEPQVFITTMRIHEDMPEFTFIRTLGDFVEFPEMIAEERHVSITILDEDGNLIQEIDEITQGGHLSWAVPEHEIFEIRFDDFNFNGYMDMWIVANLLTGTTGGEVRYHWLWDSSISQFVFSEQLSSLSGWLGVDYETQRLRVSHRAASNHFIFWFYEYHDGEFVHVAIDEQIDYELTHYELYDGEFVVVARSTFIIGRDNETGQEYSETTRTCEATGEVTVEVREW